jgi:hypothetical protein
MSVPAPAASHGLRATRMPQRSKPGEGPIGRRGRSRRANAPISAGSTVTAPTATAATTIAEPTPSRPTNGIPVASRPVSATTTIAPAAITDVPAVRFATRALCTTESPAASCSRYRPAISSA